MHAATHDELFGAREARGTVAAFVPANGRSRSMARALASGRNVAFLRFFALYVFCLTVHKALRVEPKTRASFLGPTLAARAPRASPRVVPGDMSASASTLFTPRLVVRGGTRRAPVRRVVPVARAGAHVPKSPTRSAKAAMALSATSSAVCAPAFASAGDRVADLALSDAWFGWYFAPGGVVLGPALIFTAFILGQALFEKLTGTGPKGKKKE